MGEQLKASIDNLVQKLISWMDSIILNIPNIFLAICVFVVAIYLSRKISRKVVSTLSKRQVQGSITTLIGSAISIGFILFGIILTLGILNLDQALNSIIAGAGVAGIAIGLAVQGTLSNTFSGISLSIKNDFNVGDYIEANGYAGTVEAVNLRDTKIRTVDNNVVILPNNSISDNPYKNYSITNDLRVVVETSVGYESDLEDVIRITKEAITNEFHYRKEDFEFYYTSFGDSAINIQVRFWIQATEKNTLTKARSKAIILIKNTFDRQGISIPFCN
jgi:small conductance mechanosensitive channel